MFLCLKINLPQLLTKSPIKSPRKLRGPTRLGTISIQIYHLSRSFRPEGQKRLNYSTIDTTLPEPTVRPPSRYQTGVLRYTNSDFLCDLCGKIRIFRCVRVVFRNFCYHGVITVFLVFLAYFFLHS